MTKYIVQNRFYDWLYLRRLYVRGVTAFDEEHDALHFDSYWSALWQAIKYFGRVKKVK
jgi:hypothetical protein